MPAKQYPPILPTPLKGKLKDEDILRAVRTAIAARLKAEAGKTRRSK